MIFTIGYQKLNPDALQSIIQGLHVTHLVDCRSKPKSHHLSEFNSDKLEARYNGKRKAAEYVWYGDVLGGRAPGVLPVGIQKLRQLSAGNKIMLMCMERAPGDCHRHHNICAPHFPGAIHIYQDELFTARSLQNAFTAGPGVPYRPWRHGSLSRLIEESA